MQKVPRIFVQIIPRFRSTRSKRLASPLAMRIFDTSITHNDRLAQQIYDVFRRRVAAEANFNTHNGRCSLVQCDSCHD